MVYHLIQWELFAIFAPEKIRLDLFDLLCVRGGGFLNCLFVTPELRIEPKPIIKTTRQHVEKNWEPYMQRVYKTYHTLTRFYHFRKDERHLFSDFFEAW